MTLVVAAKTDRGVVLAGDSEYFDGYNRGQLTTPKIWSDGNYVFGATGELRTSQVLRYCVDWSQQWSRSTGLDECKVVRSIVPAMISATQEAGVYKEDEATKIDADLIIACGNKLVMVDGSFAVISDTTGRMAIGSGAQIALGVLGTVGVWTEDDIVTAVHEAAKIADGVGGTIYVISTRDGIVREAS